ncbi:MAG: hypothetical protein JRJ03_01830 [Deltaproteobacteria bacterium]|nr:hypothetical protein [Deltaproteobacteria bacterium]
MRIADILGVKVGTGRALREASPVEVNLRQCSGLVEGGLRDYGKDEDTLCLGPGTPRRWGPEVERYYDLFYQRGEEIRERVRGNRSISPSPILSDLYSIINNGLTEELYGYCMFAHQDRDDLLTHGIDVMCTSLMVGLGLKFDIKALLKAGLAGYLENVGMYRIPKGILEKREKLTKEDISAIQAHPMEGYEILRALGDKYHWLAEAALCVHERMDGSGYPKGRSGEEVPTLSYLIGLVDMYTAMIRERPYRRRIPKTEAIKYIVGETKTLFPSRVRKAFLERISLFPVGTCVKLNNGTVGCVVLTNRNQAVRPTIQVLRNGAGRPSEGEEILNLAENPLLYIAEEVGGSGPDSVSPQ